MHEERKAWTHNTWASWISIDLSNLHRNGSGLNLINNRLRIYFLLKNTWKILSTHLLTLSHYVSVSFLDYFPLITGCLRGFIADYGVPLMVLLWTAISYISAGSIPKGIPRRLFSPNPWSSGAFENWTVIKAWLVYKS